MAPLRKRKHHIVLILALLAAGVFFLVREFEKEKLPPGVPRIVPEKKTEGPAPRSTKAMLAIVIDDLGPNKNMARQVIRLKVPVTLSILPQQPFSRWIAEEGHRNGHEVIVHMPMEAEGGMKPGPGGLYTWMTDAEIIEAIAKNIDTVPYAIGVSNHMGSAFTQDERAMNVLLAELKKRGLFFLDSLTTAGSVGTDTARKHGMKASARDIFLDDRDDPEDIKVQWQRVHEVSRNKGHAILLAHPRKNTMEFLRKALKENNGTEIVPISVLMK